MGVYQDAPSRDVDDVGPGGVDASVSSIRPAQHRSRRRETPPPRCLPERETLLRARQ